MNEIWVINSICFLDSFNTYTKLLRDGIQSVTLQLTPMPIVNEKSHVKTTVEDLEKSILHGYSRYLCRLISVYS